MLKIANHQRTANQCHNEISPHAVLCLVAQSCLTLCDPMDCSPPDSSVHGILQAKILEWVAMPSLRGSSQPRIEPMSPELQILYSLSHQGSPRILEWVGSPFSRGACGPRNRMGSPALQADSLPSQQPKEAKWFSFKWL